VYIRNNVALSRDHFYNGKAKMRCVYIVELQATLTIKEV
jgi:hypothetical protein